MNPLLEIRDLRIEARIAGGEATLLHDVCLRLGRGEVVGVVGESGSGKTTLVRALMGLLDQNVRVAGGSVSFEGAPLVSPTEDRTHRVRGARIGMIFQDAGRSLDPLARVGVLLHEVLRAHRPEISRDEARERMVSSLSRMLIAEPERVLDSYPHQLSGGMRQRVAIALAILTEPALVLADECTTALDVTAQAEVVDLLRELISDTGMGMIFVTHDLLLAADLCDQLVVMSGGRVVEAGPTERLLESPTQEYTRELLAAVPAWDGDGIGG